MTKSTKRGKAAPSMSVEEFREHGFILGPTVLAEIVSLVTGPNYTRRAALARVRDRGEFTSPFFLCAAERGTSAGPHPSR